MIHKFKNSSVRYNLRTGVFVWEVCCRKPWMNGKRAEKALANGYLYIKADGKNHSASRLAWFLMNGPIPSGLEIDHINRKRSDNRIFNLRVATRKENLANTVRFPGITGVCGVSVYNRPSGNGCLYRIRPKNKVIYFQTLKEAKLALEKYR